MKLYFSILSIWFLAFAAQADTQYQRQKHYNLKGGIALQGYDPVSYFSGKPKKGDTTHIYSKSGVTYHFSSAENLREFKSNPTKYEPAYGGWCAYAFAVKAGKVRVNPKSYKIIKGRIYLFYKSVLWGDTLKSWNSESEESQLKIAQSEWRKLVS